MMTRVKMTGEFALVKKRKKERKTYGKEFQYTVLQL